MHINKYIYIHFVHTLEGRIQKPWKGGCIGRANYHNYFTNKSLILAKKGGGGVCGSTSFLQAPPPPISPKPVPVLYHYREALISSAK